MSKKINIMLIDDNKIDLFINNQFINQTNIANTITEYPFVTDALEFLKQNDSTQWPNLILCDIHMPVMNGFEFVEEYALLPEELRKNCKIVILTSSLNEGDKDRINENPQILALLEKPLNIAELKSLLEKEKII